MSFFRYPGGKSKIRNQIIEKIVEKKGSAEQYCEPFFGGGSIGLKLINNFKKFWINDIDVGISCLWTSVINHPEKLKEFVLEYKPKVEDFYKFREELINLVGMSEIEIGFKKLVIHQISYSGLGVKSGGPLGGKSQNSKYKIDCRWSPEYICQKIDKIHNQFKSVDLYSNGCTCLDFSFLLENNDCSKFFYLDPPYYVKGNELYQYGFSKEDHKRLSSALKHTKHNWLLSYDNCDEVHNLYDWAEREELTVNYTITSLKDKKTGNRESRSKKELLIWKNL